MGQEVRRMDKIMKELDKWKRQRYMYGIVLKVTIEL